MIIGLALVPVGSSLAKTPEQHVEARQQIMKYIGTHMRTLSGMQRGQIAYDPEYVKAVTDAFVAMSASLKVMFPENSFLATSDAREAIQGSEEFMDMIDNFGQVSRDVGNSPSQETFADTFPRLGGTCSVCHRMYRK